MSPRYDPARIRECIREIRLDSMYRLIRSIHGGTPLEAVPTPSRFGDPEQRYAVLYAAGTVRCAFCEAVVRNRLTRRRHREIPRSEVEARIVVSLRSRRSLSLIDLRGDGAIRIGAPTAVAHDSNHAAGRALSSAVYDHVPEADGFLYQSRFTGHDCVAIFDRAFESLTLSWIMPLTRHGDFLDALDDYDIILTERPG